MKELFTNCKTCHFYQPKLDKAKEDTCSLGKWRSPGFLGKIRTELGDAKVIDRFCQFHRSKEWANTEIANGTVSSDIEALVNEQVKLQYAMIHITRGGMFGETIQIIKDAFDHEIPPQELCIINLHRDVSENKRLISLVHDLDLKLKSRFKIKLAMSDKPKENFVDEFVMVGKIQSPFYIFSDNEKVDPGFVDGLQKMINGDMMRVMYAGDDKVHFLLSKLHEVTKSGFDRYLRSHNIQDSIYSYDEVCNY